MFESAPVLIPNAFYPGWLPQIGSTLPVLFADFSTEGTTNHYWYNGIAYPDLGSWLVSITTGYARASPAYFTNSSGLLQQAGSGQRRIPDYDPITLAPKGFLVEGQSTNLALQSNTFSNAAWVAQATTNAQNIVGPDGVTNSAWTLQDDSTNNQHYIFNNGTISTANGQIFTFSAFVKQGTNQYCQLTTGSSGFSALPFANFDLQAGTITNIGVGNSQSATITPYRNGWFRITLTATADGTGTSGLVLAIINAANAARLPTYVGSFTNVFIFGAQAEQLPNASTYIPTTTGTATRLTDNQLTAQTLSFGSALTLFSVFTQNGENSRAGNLYNAQIGYLNDGGGNSSIDLGARTVTATIEALVSNASTGVANSTSSVSKVLNTEYRCANRVALGNYAIAVNGTLNTFNPGTGGPPPATPMALQFGNDNGLIFPFFGTIKKYGIWQVAATDAQLQALTL